MSYIHATHYTCVRDESYYITSDHKSRINKTRYISSSMYVPECTRILDRKTSFQILQFLAYVYVFEALAGMMCKILMQGCRYAISGTVRRQNFLIFCFRHEHHVYIMSTYMHTYTFIYIYVCNIHTDHTYMHT